MFMKLNRTVDIQLKRDLISLHLSKTTADTQLTKLKKDLLSHLNRHPRAKFSAGAIPHAVSRVRKVDVEQALEGLVTDDLIEKHTNQQGQLFYCLNNDPEKQEPVLSTSSCNENNDEECLPTSTPRCTLMVTKLRQLRLLEEPVFIGGKTREAVSV